MTHSSPVTNVRAPWHRHEPVAHHCANWHGAPFVPWCTNCAKVHQCNDGWLTGVVLGLCFSDCFCVTCTWISSVISVQTALCFFEKFNPPIQNDPTCLALRLVTPILIACNAPQKPNPFWFTGACNRREKERLYSRSHLGRNW